MTTPYHNASDENVINDIKSLDQQIKDLTSTKKIAQQTLLERRGNEIEDALKKKTEPFGSVSTVIGTDKVTFTTPKKVEWAQPGMKALHDQMIADGADPLEYMQVEYSVKEDAYKNWPSNLKEHFEPLRTVTPGNISIKIEPAKEK